MRGRIRNRKGLNINIGGVLLYNIAKDKICKDIHRYPTTSSLGGEKKKKLKKFLLDPCAISS